VFAVFAVFTVFAVFIVLQNGIVVLLLFDGAALLAISKYDNGLVIGGDIVGGVIVGVLIGGGIDGLRYGGGAGGVSGVFSVLLRLNDGIRFGLVSVLLVFQKSNPLDLFLLRRLVLAFVNGVVVFEFESLCLFVSVVFIMLLKSVNMLLLIVVNS
jgi:hypothetical protein